MGKARERGHAVSIDFPDNLLNASLHCQLHKVGFVECRLSVPSTVSCMNSLAKCNYPECEIVLRIDVCPYQVTIHTRTM